ncbi:hypothetical protein SAMN02745664_1321 [Moraxella cuniculi DSM 21768]|uniref:Uncharacterized protein n=1 Tax=Moraxella cuniculi DSM 21768 TaxID=1122245 RepID=A0A1N7GBJ8_9GAMM|nr:hypothetical protein [Moraxella cuniculi]OOS02151.1 hypothetical protein B0189_10910 [Moraxella cuniculi]SIS09949.1 hypothetical protein SAMN02745664_1321 [Moraxella cuniculi DSM 21768]
MIIDLPPQLEQAIINKAQAQGVSVAELLQRTFANEPQLDAEPASIAIGADDGALLQQLLDNPPPPSPAMRELLALHGANHA